MIDAGTDHDAAHGHGTRRGYLIGFLLAVALTAIPFALVMAGIVNDVRVAAVAIVALAAVQVAVHMIFFLHLDTRAEGGWTMMALIFTIVVVVIALSGTLWVMFHLNANMMPMPAHAMTDTP